MTRDKQHKLGIKAGEIIRKIHSIPMNMMLESGELKIINLIVLVLGFRG